MAVERSGEQDAKAAVLRIIVEQFVTRAAHPLSDLQTFERLAGGLIDLLDAESVAPVARRLCLHPETPASIISRLFEKGGECARIAFEAAPHTPAPDVLAIAEHGPVELAESIARRPELDRGVVAALVTRGEAEVLRALAGNRRTRLDPLALRALVLAGRDDLALARILLDREDLEIDREPLFLAATRAERAAIVLNACRAALASRLLDASPRLDPELAARLEACAVARDREGVVSVIADALDCRKSRSRAIVADAGGEALALTLKAMGLAPDAACRQLLCAGAAISHDVKRLQALEALMKSVPSRAAARIVAAMSGAARPEREAPRRQILREETQARRAAPARANGARQGKLDQLA